MRPLFTRDAQHRWGAILCATATTLFALLAGRAEAQSAQPSPGATTVDSRVESGLREPARSGSLAGLRWPNFPDHRGELAALYAANQWQPLWTVSGRPTAAAREAIALLRSADERALHPDDYDAATLDRRAGQLASGSEPDARDVAWFDAALSVGLLRHLSDVHLGRVNPRTLAVGINVQPKKLELARVVREAIVAGRLRSLVRDVEPRFVQYRNLIAAYTRYRALADSALPALAPMRATVRPGGSFVQANALRRRLVAFGDLDPRDARGSDSAAYDAATAGAVARFQKRHGLAPDSVLGSSTVAAIAQSPQRRLRQLELAIERIRWLPALDAGPFIVVNVPAFQLYGFDSVGGAGAPTLEMNVVVGRAGAGRATPLFEDRMEYVIFRPYWVIPPGILGAEILPAARRSPDYLARNGMEVYAGDGDSGPGLPASASNLSRVASGTLGIRQKPGPRNSLGLAKFIFPNDHNVYLHGTPATELFARARRDFSHGCIRLEDPAAVAVWVLHDPARWSRPQVDAAMNGERSSRVDLTRQLPVVIYYTTAVVRPEGTVSFYEDVYGHDARLERALAKGYPFAR